mmetsp:Transcript_77248/g.213646  ORF Transcript_77248/g.213646 Transcript_77248/m.213646 type:complete len:286 (+) Transcript_77248:424-1281(+)
MCDRCVEPYTSGVGAALVCCGCGGRILCPSLQSSASDALGGVALEEATVLADGGRERREGRTRLRKLSGKSRLPIAYSGGIPASASWQQSEVRPGCEILVMMAPPPPLPPSLAPLSCWVRPLSRSSSPSLICSGWCEAPRLLVDTGVLATVLAGEAPTSNTSSPDSFDNASSDSRVQSQSTRISARPRRRVTLHNASAVLMSSFVSRTTSVPARPTCSSVWKDRQARRACTQSALKVLLHWLIVMPVGKFTSTVNWSVSVSWAELGIKESTAARTAMQKRDPATT